MFRTLFNDPRPANHEELTEAFDELGLNPAECSAILSDNSGEDDPYDGWTAEINGTDEDGEFKEFSTVAFKSLTALRNDLTSLGLTDITVS